MIPLWPHLLAASSSLSIDGLAIGDLVLQTPEIEAAYAIGLKRLCHREGAIENFVLLSEGEVCAEAAALAELRFRRSGPVGLEKRAGDVGHLQLVFFQNPARLGDFLLVEVDDVLLPHAAQFHPLQAEFVGGNLAGMAEILADFVIDHRNTEGRTGAGRRSEPGCSAGGCHGGHPLQKLATSERHDLLLALRRE